MMQKVTLDFAIDATTLLYNQRLTENGFAKMLIVNCGSLTNAVTLTVDVKDAQGYVVWSKATVPKDAITRFDYISTPIFKDIPMQFDGSVSITLSGVAGGSGGSATVVLYVEADC